jgi:hypothetical protein
MCPSAVTIRAHRHKVRIQIFATQLRIPSFGADGAVVAYVLRATIAIKTVSCPVCLGHQRRNGPQYTKAKLKCSAAHSGGVSRALHGLSRDRPVDSKGGHLSAFNGFSYSSLGLRKELLLDMARKPCNNPGPTLGLSYDLCI